MDLLRSVTRRSFVSEVVYVVLNIVLAIAVAVLIRVTGSPWPSLLLVLLSKWRVLAVRPRFWFTNIQANLVDMIVGFSIVALMYTNYSVATDSLQQLTVLCLLGAFYAAWLLFLKPRSKRRLVALQAAAALFVGTAALYTISYAWPVSLVVIGMWLIGYATARHILSHYEESHVLLLSLVWGLVLGEIGWAAYHWAIAYTFMPQVAIIVLCLGFVAYKAYDSYSHYDRVRTNDILLPLIFTVAISAVLLIFFNTVSTGTV